MARNGVGAASAGGRDGRMGVAAGGDARLNPWTAGARFKGGEPLRGLAAMAIVAYHLAFFVAGAGADGLPIAWIQPTAQTGDRILGHLIIGLPVFFVLSGYLIGRPFVQALIAGRPLPRVRVYARNRALRIVPAFWVAATLTFVIHGTLGSSAGDVAAVFAFLQIFEPSAADKLIGQAWSLDVEALFYLAMPLAVGLLVPALAWGAPGVRAIIVVAILLATAAASLSLEDGRGPAAGGLTLAAAKWYAFVPGLLLAVAELWLPRRLAGHQATARRIAAAIAVAGIAAFAASIALESGRRLTFALLFTLAAGAFVAAPLLLQWGTGRCWAALDNGPLRWLGLRSYSIYLLHFVVMLSVLPALQPDGGGGTARRLATAAVVVAVTLVVADLSLRFVERPFLARKGRTAPPAPGPAVVPAGGAEAPAAAARASVG